MRQRRRSVGRPRVPRALDRSGRPRRPLHEVGREREIRVIHRYGAGPLHLLAHLAGLAIAAYALAQLLGENNWVNFLAWFIGAALLHDLVLLPIYTALDRLAHGGIHAKRRRR